MPEDWGCLSELRLSKHPNSHACVRPVTMYDSMERK